MDNIISKLKNWWWYNKLYAIIALVAAAGIIYMLMPSKEPKPDYSVGLVTALPCTEQRLAGIEERLTAAGEDINGDGQLIVRLRSFTVDLESPDPNAGYNNYEIISVLDADLVGKVCGLYILEAPDAFQRATDGLMSEPFAPFDDKLTMALRKDSSEEYITLFENLK